MVRTALAFRNNERSRAAKFLLCIAKESATKALQSQKSLNGREPPISSLVCRRQQATVFRIPDHLFKVHSRVDVHLFSSFTYFVLAGAASGGLSEVATWAGSHLPPAQFYVRTKPTGGGTGFVTGLSKKLPILVVVGLGVRRIHGYCAEATLADANTTAAARIAAILPVSRSPLSFFCRPLEGRTDRSICVRLHVKCAG
jgi:hypothetical protein